MFNFIKSHGLGNDFVIFPEHKNLNISEKLIKFLSDRKTGIGCDLVVFIYKSDNDYSDLSARFFNKDGSEAEICGNALRCIGKYYFEKFNKKQLTIETYSGLIDLEEYDSEKIAVDLGLPNLNWKKIPLGLETQTENLGINFNYLKDGFALNVGNPHVIFFNEEINNKKLESEAQKILKTNLFPSGININVVKVISKTEIKILTHERGVGLTQACGSGAGASAFVSNRLKYCDNKIKVQMNGGNLDVEITKDGHILIIGDAKEVYEGKINLKGYE